MSQEETFLNAYLCYVFFKHISLKFCVQPNYGSKRFLLKYYLLWIYKSKLPTNKTNIFMFNSLTFLFFTNYLEEKNKHNGFLIRCKKKIFFNKK